MNFIDRLHLEHMILINSGHMILYRLHGTSYRINYDNVHYKTIWLNYMYFSRNTTSVQLALNVIKHGGANAWNQTGNLVLLYHVILFNVTQTSFL